MGSCPRTTTTTKELSSDRIFGRTGSHPHSGLRGGRDRPVNPIIAVFAAHYGLTYAQAAEIFGYEARGEH